jgi:hypothetical protein
MDENFLNSLAFGVGSLIKKATNISPSERFMTAYDLKSHFGKCIDGYKEDRAKWYEEEASKEADTKKKIKIYWKAWLWLEKPGKKEAILNTLRELYKKIYPETSTKSVRLIDKIVWNSYKSKRKCEYKETVVIKDDELGEGKTECIVCYKIGDEILLSVWQKMLDGKIF